MIRLTALLVPAQMDLEVCSAKKILTTVNPIPALIVELAQIWCPITPVRARKVSTAITAKTVLTTVEEPTAAIMVSVSILAQDSTATVEVDTLENTASLK